MKENVIKFSYKGGSNYIDYLMKNNKLNLLQELSLEQKLDKILVQEIESMLNDNRANIITLILGRTLSYKGLSLIINCYSQIQLDLLNTNYSVKDSIPMLYYDSPELKAPVLFFTWQGLQSLIKNFDIIDLLAV